MIGFITTYVPMTYGVVLGAYAGYIGGRFDAVLMRVIDVAMAFPFLVLIIVILAILGPGVQNIYISVFLVAWTMYARLARAEMMVERTKDYMTAAQVLGFPAAPHHLPPRPAQRDQLLDRLLGVGFRAQHPAGLGPQLPRPRHPAADPGMGRHDRRGKDFIRQAWWIGTLPGFAIVLTGTALSLIGDGLAQRLGERHHTMV